MVYFGGALVLLLAGVDGLISPATQSRTSLPFARRISPLQATIEGVEEDLDDALESLLGDVVSEVSGEIPKPRRVPEKVALYENVS